MAADALYAALDAFLTEHRLCRPGLAEPDAQVDTVALACTCGAVLAHVLSRRAR